MTFPVLSLAVLLALSTLSIAQTCSTPSTISGYSNSKLPNPFVFNDNSAVKTKADWDCRRQQLSALIQGYEAGSLPGKPQSVTGSWSGAKLSVSVTDNGKSTTFSNPITIPSGTAPAGGWPLVIALGGASLPIPSGVAVMNFDNGAAGAQGGSGTRGQGYFYTIYGSGNSASSMTAWTWAVSRIIDALETTPGANINTKKIGVTGCSRNGKGALMIGAFETRIALTIPQESGSGGDACWRVSKYENDKGVKSQPATQIVTENPWFSKTLDSYVNNLNALPYDHHELIGMVAPRGYIGFENTDYVWLSPLGAYACEKAAHNIFTALGVPDNHGYAQIGGHDHCAWPSSLTPVLNAFIDKFLNGKSTDTSNKVTTNNQFQGLTYTESDWINWTTPILSGSSGGGTTTDVSTTTSSATSTSTTVVPTATTTTSTTAPPPTTSGAAQYAQCGGKGWTGTTTCRSPFTCKVSNEYYSQCL